MRLILALAALIALAGPAMASEEPAYTLIAREGDFEIRDYPALILAEVQVEGDRRAATNAGFGPLANYVFGGNQPAERIAMTAPVTSEPSGEGRWRVAFIMPAQWSMETLPAPNDASVSLRETPARRVAVLRFSGLMGERRASEKLAELEAVLVRRGLEPVSGPTFAAYDPPWIPGPFRRNEIWIEIAA
ncbi:MAG: SOUL family heme-binding protein [Oceanicaulis sp.]